MSNKTKITFVVSESLQNELRERIVQDGYGLRGKSKWISEAIHELLNMKNYPELIKFNEEMKGFGKLETIVAEYPLKITIEAAILQARKKFPTLEGVQSCLVRTAIIQRLLHK